VATSVLFWTADDWLSIVRNSNVCGGSEVALGLVESSAILFVHYG